MSRVGVPADFGVENLDSVVHGNVTLLLSDGLNMKANSMILAINSPVFRRIFIEQEQTVVDFKTFDASSVRLFIRSLYSGKCHFALMSSEEVQEVMEASEAMDVVWLKEKCKQYQLERRNSVSPAIPVIERPSRPSSAASRGPSRDRQSSKRSNHRDDTSESSDMLFRKKSLFDLRGELSDMDLSLPITPSSEEVPTTSDEARSTQSKESEPSSSRGRERTPDYKRIRRTVACSSELESDSESTSRNPRVSDSDHRRSGSSSRHSSVKKRGLVSVVSKPIRPNSKEPAHPVFRDSNPELPNLFWTYRDHLGPLVKNKNNLGDVLEALQSCREMRSLYMLFEALDLIGRSKPALKVSASDIKLISELRRRKGWGRVSPQFLENCTFYNRHFVDSEELSKERKELVSRSDSKKIPDSLPPYSIRLEDLLRAVRVVEFQFKHPAIQNCTRRGKCGFLLQLTGETQRNRSTGRDRSTLLHVRLLRSARFYTNSKVHYHDEVMSPDKMHLVVEEHFTTRSATSGTNKTTYVSWQGRPFLDRHSKSETVTWGDLQIPSQRHAKLVVYYDVTEEDSDVESVSSRCQTQFNRSKRKRG